MLSLMMQKALQTRGLPRERSTPQKETEAVFGNASNEEFFPTECGASWLFRSSPD